MSKQGSGGAKPFSIGVGPNMKLIYNGGRALPPTSAASSEPVGHSELSQPTYLVGTDWKIERYPEIFKYLRRQLSGYTSHIIMNHTKDILLLKDIAGLEMVAIDNDYIYSTNEATRYSHMLFQSCIMIQYMDYNISIKDKFTDEARVELSYRIQELNNKKKNSPRFLNDIHMDFVIIMFNDAMHAGAPEEEYNKAASLHLRDVLVHALTMLSKPDMPPIPDLDATIGRFQDKCDTVANRNTVMPKILSIIHSNIDYHFEYETTPAKIPYINSPTDTLVKIFFVNSDNVQSYLEDFIVNTGSADNLPTVLLLDDAHSREATARTYGAEIVKAVKKRYTEDQAEHASTIAPPPKPMKALSNEALLAEFANEPPKSSKAASRKKGAGGGGSLAPKGTGGGSLAPKGTGGGSLAPKGTGGGSLAPKGTGGGSLAPKEILEAQIRKLESSKTAPSEASASVDPVKINTTMTMLNRLKRFKAGKRAASSKAAAPVEESSAYVANATAAPVEESSAYVANAPVEGASTHGTPVNLRALFTKRGASSSASAAETESSAAPVSLSIVGRNEDIQEACLVFIRNLQIHMPRLLLTKLHRSWGQVPPTDLVRCQVIGSSAEKMLLGSFPFQFTSDIDVKILLAPILSKHTDTYNNFLKNLQNIIILFLKNNEFITNNVELTANNYANKDVFPIPKLNEMYTPDELTRLVPATLKHYNGEEESVLELPPNSPFQCSMLYNQGGKAHLIRIQSRLPSGSIFIRGREVPAFETLLDISTNIQRNNEGWESMQNSASIRTPHGDVLVRQPRFLAENIKVMSEYFRGLYGQQRNKLPKLQTRRNALQKKFPHSVLSKENIEGFAHYRKSSTRKRRSSLVRRSSLKGRRTLRRRNRFSA